MANYEQTLKKRGLTYEQLSPKVKKQINDYKLVAEQLATMKEGDADYNEFKETLEGQDAIVVELVENFDLAKYESAKERGNNMRAKKGQGQKAEKGKVVEMPVQQQQPTQQQPPVPAQQQQQPAQQQQAAAEPTEEKGIGVGGWIGIAVGIAGSVFLGLAYKNRWKPFR